MSNDSQSAATSASGAGRSRDIGTDNRRIPPPIWERVSPRILWGIAFTAPLLHVIGISVQAWSGPAMLEGPASLMAAIWCCGLFVLWGCTVLFLAVANAASAVANAMERREWKSSLSRFAACLCSIALFVPANQIAWRIRQWGMIRASMNGHQVVAALNRFHADHRQYPERLEELVPRYLPSIPRTGMIGYSAFEYRTPIKEPAPAIPGFEVWIDCSWATNFDRFFYWPTETYPQTIYGGSVEPIGTWAYVHE